MPVTVALTAAAAGASSLAASVSMEKNAFDLARIWDLLPSLRGPLKPRFEFSVDWREGLAMRPMRFAASFLPEDF